MNAIWKWIKKQLIQPASMSNKDTWDGMEWSNFDIDRLDHELEVSVRAELDGARGIPSEYDETDDPVEVKIENHLKVAIGVDRLEAQEKADLLTMSVVGDQLTTIETDIPAKHKLLKRKHKIKLEQEKPSQDTAEENLESEHSAEKKLAGQEYRTEIENFDRRERDERGSLPDYVSAIADYREEWGLKRGPQLKPPEENTFNILILGVCVLLQMGANTFLLQGATPYGPIVSLFLALIVGGTDLGVQWFFGRHGSAVKAPDPISKRVGFVCIIPALVIGVGLNLMMVHTRRVSMDPETVGTLFAGEGFMTEVFEGMRESLLMFPDIISYFALVLGLFCTGLAFKAGWEWDEQIPVYFKNQKKIDGYEAELENIRQHRNAFESDYNQSSNDKDAADREARLKLKRENEDALSRMKETALDESILQAQEFVTQARQLVRNTTGALKRVDRLENKLVQQERNAKQAFRTLVAMYRADNTVARKSDEEVGPPPAHWSRGVQPLELDERAALKDTLELESKVQAWAAKIEERVEQIKHDENEKLNELKETRRQRRENRFKNRSLKGGAPPAAPLNTSAGSVADYNRQNKNRKDQ